MERFNIIQGQVARPRVDFVNKIIHGVAVCAEGEAKGHSCFIGNEFLTKLAALGNEKGKVMVHLGHYNKCSDADPISTALGVCKNFTIDVACVRGDIHFLYSEADAKVIDKLLEFADQHPETFGLSIVFELETEAVENELGETERMPKYLADPTGQDRAMVSISRLIGVDFVEFPAANDMLFSEFTEAGKATQALNRIKKNAPTLFQKVSTFAKKYFGLDMEQVEAQKEAPQKTEQTKPTNKKMSILSNLFGFSKKKAEPTAKKFGEIAGDDGTMYAYEGEELLVGETLTIVDPTTGESVAAPAGEHVMADGTLVICDDMGMISSVTPPAAVEVASETISEQLSVNEVTKKQLAAARVALAAKDKQIAKINEAAKNAGVFTNTQNPEKVTEKLSVKELNDFVSKIKTFKKVGNNHPSTQGMRSQTASIDDVRNAHATRMGLATGADFIGSVATACKEYMTPELFMGIYTESVFLASITDITTNSPYSSTNQLSIKLPLVDLENALLNGQALRAATPGCVDIGSLAPTAKAILSDKLLQVAAIEASWLVCPNDQEWREVFNRLIWVDEMTLPIEAIFMQLWIARIQRSIVELLVNGNNGTVGGYATGAPINGLVKQIADDVLALAIPAAQVFDATHTNWTASNAKGFIDEAVRALPSYMREGAQQGSLKINMYISRTVWEKYRQNLENLSLVVVNPFGNNPYGIENMNQIYDVTGVPVTFVILESLNRTSGLNDTGLYFMTAETRILHLHSDKSSIGNPEVVYRNQIDNKISMRWGFFEGVTYPFAKDIVTNIPATI